MQLDLHPKRVRVAIVLVTLGLCAFFLAQGATSWVAGAYLPPNLPSAAIGGGSGQAEDFAKGQNPPDMQAILARNFFDPTTGPLWPPKPKDVDPNAPPEAGGDGDAPPPPLAAGQMPPACDGQVRLVAAIYSKVMPEWSFASLSLGAASPLLYRPGAQVENRQVDSIYPEAVFLKGGNGVLCSLTMFKSPDAPVKPPAPAAAPAATDAAATNYFGSSLSEAELDQNIHQISDTKYTINRSLLDKVLANQSELMRSARVVPHEENGRVIGVKLYGIRRTSLLGKLGLQNGDLMRTVNGFDMASPDTALEAYTKLRSASNLSVAVTRRGSAVTMDYQVGQ